MEVSSPVAQLDRYNYEGLRTGLVKLAGPVAVGAGQAVVEADPVLVTPSSSSAVRFAARSCLSVEQRA